MANSLTHRQEQFIYNVFQGMSQRDAYKTAYDCSNITVNVIDEKASHLMAQDKLQARLTGLQQELQDRNMVTVERVLTELARIGYSDIRNYMDIERADCIVGYKDKEKTIPITQKRDQVTIKDSSTWTASQAAAVQSIKQGPNGVEIKLYSKVDALELIGKHLAMYTERIDNVHVHIVSEAKRILMLPEDERQLQIAELAKLASG